MSSVLQVFLRNLGLISKMDFALFISRCLKNIFSEKKKKERKDIKILSWNNASMPSSASLHSFKASFHENQYIRLMIFRVGNEPAKQFFLLYSFPNKTL